MSYDVSFPALGMEFHLSPVAFSIGPFSIYWYGILIALGVLLAFWYAMRSCKKMNIDPDKLIDVVLVGIIGGIIGARLYYVLFYSGDEFIQNPWKIFDIRDGGLAIYGGIIGSVVCGSIVAKLHKMKIAAVLDLASLGFLIGQAVGRWGNFVNQEAFGSETDLPWGMLSERTEAVVPTGPVHPCFLYESLWCFLGFLLLHVICRKFRRYDGQVFLSYIIWYGIGRFFIEGLRTDSLMTPFFDLRVSQVVAAASVLAGIVLMIVFCKRTSLSGCGSRKIMELNGIQDEIPEEEIIDDGTSTIFGDLEIEEDEGDALADEEPDGTPKKKEEPAQDTAEASEAEQNTEAEEPSQDQESPEQAVQPDDGAEDADASASGEAAETSEE